jgi:class 3 adenylate cyclase
VFKQATTLATRLGDANSRAVAVLGLGVAPSTPGVPDLGLIAMLEDALGAMEPGDSPLRAALMGRLAEELYWSEQSTRRDELSSAAVEMARRTGDKRTLVDTLYRRHIVLTGPDTTEERLALSTEIVGLIRDIGHSDARLRAHYLRIEDLLELGDVTGADAELEVYRQHARELRQEHLGMVDLVLAMRALMSGRFEEGEQLGLRGFEAIQHRREGFSTQVLAAQMFIVRREQGRLSELAPVVKTFTTQYPTLTFARCGLAFFYAELGDSASASFEFEYFWKANFRTVQRNATWLPSLVLLSEVCAFLKNREAAAELYQLLSPYAARISMLDVYVCYGSVAHYLGILAATLGNFEAAAAHFEAALDVYLKMNARPLMAYTQYEYAKMLLAHGLPADREKALIWGSAALSTAEALGMKTLVATLHATIGPDPRAEAGPDGTVTLLFTDIVDSSGITERLGDLRTQELLHAHNKIVREALNAHRGFEVKNTGDGFMIAFPGAGMAVRCAVAIQRALASYRAAHPEAPIHVSIGLNTGEAIREAGDFYGRTVILASRICEQASGDEVLVSATSKDILESSDEFRFDLNRETDLKGFSGKHRLFTVLWRDDTSSAGDIRELIPRKGTLVEEKKNPGSLLCLQLTDSGQHSAMHDERIWRDLLHRFHTIANEQVTLWKGHKISEDADSLVATFNGLVEGVWAATAIKEAINSIRMSIRAALFVGNQEMTRDQALVQAQALREQIFKVASIGEVLISSPFREPATEDRIRLTGKGVLQIKGIPNDCYLFKADIVGPGIGQKPSPG